eukprot:1151657-Amphidinium_carterae.1
MKITSAHPSFQQLNPNPAPLSEASRSLRYNCGRKKDSQRLSSSSLQRRGQTHGQAGENIMYFWESWLGPLTRRTYPP